MAGTDDRTDEYRKGYKAGFEVGRRKVAELAGMSMENVDTSGNPVARLSQAQVDEIMAGLRDLLIILKAWANKNTLF